MPFRRRAFGMGTIFEDAADAVGGAASDVFSEIPYSSDLTGALKDLANGPLRDFARTPVGTAVFRAMTTTVYGPLAWAIGPQIAAVAFAIPGLARGEDFLHAWTTEFNWRAQKTAEILGPTKLEDLHLDGKIIAAAQKLTAWAPEEVQRLALSELASRLGVDELTALLAGQALGYFATMSADELSDLFDPVTGARKRTGPAVAVGKANVGPVVGARSDCDRYRQAVADGQGAAILQSLYNKCQAEQRAANAAAPPINVASSGVESSAPKTNHDWMLFGVIALAGVALAYWAHTEGNRR